MALFGRRKQTLGLDIGSGLVKAVVIDHGGREPELQRVVLTPLPDSAIVEGEVMDQALVADAIRDTVQAAGVKAAHVVAAVGGRDVIIKRISVDRVKPSQLRELMRFEAEQHVPFDMDSVELDFHLLNPEVSDGDMSVLLVAAKRELVVARRDLVKEAGVAPAVIDVDTFALHNAFEANHPEAMRGTVALLNVGHDNTILIVMDAGVPVLTRDLPVGTRRLREAVQARHGLGAEQAEALLRADELSPLLDEAVALHGEELASGMERAATFLATTSRNLGQIRAVWACGGGARVPGFLPWLGERLRIPVQPASALAGLAVARDALDDLPSDDVAPLLMLSVGLALRAA
jgi:type IV pilus assembly protein PilM